MCWPSKPSLPYPTLRITVPAVSTTVDMDIHNCCPCCAHHWPPSFLIFVTILPRDMEKSDQIEGLKQRHERHSGNSPHKQHHLLSPKLLCSWNIWRINQYFISFSICFVCLFVFFLHKFNWGIYHEYVAIYPKLIANVWRNRRHLWPPPVVAL